MEAELASTAVDAATIVNSGPGFPVWAIFVSAAAILIAAALGAWWQRYIHRQNMTFSTLMDQLWDGDYIEQRAAFIRVRDEEPADTLVKAGTKEEESSVNATALRSILNNYELIALGIHCGVLDETIFRRYFKSTTVSDYERVKPYIDEVRKRYPRVYTEYEALYEKWRKST